MHSREPVSEFIIAGSSAAITIAMTFYISHDDLDFLEAILLYSFVAGFSAFMGIFLHKIIRNTIPPEIVTYGIFSILILSIIILFYSTMSGRYPDTHSQHYLVSGVNIRALPRLNGKILSVNHKQQPIKILEKSWRKYRVPIKGETHFDYWVKVKLPNSRTGWVYGTFIR